MLIVPTKLASLNNQFVNFNVGWVLFIMIFALKSVFNGFCILDHGLGLGFVLFLGVPPLASRNLARQIYQAS